MGFKELILTFILKIRRIAFLCFLIFYMVPPTGFCSEVTEPSISVQGKDTVYHLTHNDLKAGERIFYGLMRDQAEQTACISCHNIKPVKELNWNPSAFEIAAVSRTKSLDDLRASLISPAGKKLEQSHTGYGALTEQELVQLKGFLIEYDEAGGYHPKPVIDRLLYFIGLVVIFLLAFLDLVWFRVIRFRLVHTLVLLITSVIITKVIVEESIALGRSKNYSPDQPIKFSHMVHAGQNKIDCQYCHNGAEFSKSAGIPSASVCLNCHMIVREGTRSGRFEINKIFAAISEKKPIAWKRVYDLPDYAFFSHAQHVGAGKLACQKCHGQVEQMDRITQIPDLSMGWCISCHRNTRVQFHDNKFYEKYGELKEKLNKGLIDSVTVEMVGGTDCMKCHY
jgi:cytochrome c553